MSRNFLNDSARLARFRGERPSSALGSRNIRIETVRCQCPMQEGMRRECPGRPNSSNSPPHGRHDSVWSVRVGKANEAD